MATSKISLDTGSTLHTATHTISEDALTKHIPRSNLNNSAGAEIGVAANPLYTIPSGGTITTLGTITNIVTITGSTVVVGTVTVTGSTAVVNTVTITGSTAVVNTVTITGSTSVINIVNVTGSTVCLGGTAGTPGTNVISVQGIASMVPLTITGSTSVVNIVSVTGSTTVAGVVTITGSTAIVAPIPAGTNNIGDVDVLTMPVVTVTGSTAVIGTVTVTGSTTIVGTVTITGSTAVVNTVTVTGSTTLVHINFPNAGSATVLSTAVTNAIIVASHATLCIYLTDLTISTPAAGNVTFGQTNTTTASNVKIQTLYFAANGGMARSFMTPIKLAATTNLVYTSTSSASTSITAQYYYAA